MQDYQFLAVMCCVLLMQTWCWATAVATSSTLNDFSASVKIGAILDFNSPIGSFARKTIELAVQDVNNAHLLNATQLELEMYDSGSNPVQGAASAVELVKGGVVAVVGPQSSAVSQFAAYIGKEATVPFISFGATDPNLSETQYPYFIRVAPSDVLQMQAVAAFVGNYGWKEVVMFHMDDDYGTNGASKLSDSLQRKGSKIVDKVAFVPWVEKDGIDKELSMLTNRQTRIFIVHTQSDVGFLILQEAYYLNMMTSGYVWIVTDLVTTDLGSLQFDPKVQLYTQGVVGVRRYIRHSQELHNFVVSWKRSYPHLSLDLYVNQNNAYGLYAYDAVWTAARAISSYLNDEHEINFIKPPEKPTQSGGRSELAQMPIFQGGKTMRGYILNTSFVGASGVVKFDETGDLADAAFEYTNMVGRSLHVVGYWWANNSGVSLKLPPSTELSILDSAPDEEFFLAHDGKPETSTNMSIIWPGGDALTPRGWVLPKNGRPIKIGVPRKAGYTELVQVTINSDNTTTYTGFCIQVFEAALKYLPYAVPYTYEMFGDGLTTPEYSLLVQKLAHQEYDGVVGDVAILADRLRIVDFTQPFLESGLVVLAPVKNKRENNPWAFLRPFKAQLWITVLLSFIFTGSVIWILEHKVNEEFRGPPRTQLVTVLTFIFSTLFFSQREDTRSFLVEQLAPTIQGLETLIQSNLPIGYQDGSFVRDYLIALHVSPSRLKPLSSREKYHRALDLGPGRGGVAAIVDELPYIELFRQSNCKHYSIVGQEFTKSGWGFAFPRGSDITADLSQAILKMSQTGELQHIKDYWFKDTVCEEATNNSEAESLQLDLKSFWGLFLISAIASVVCVLLHLICLVKDYRNQLTMQQEATVLVRDGGSLQHIRKFLAYIDKSDSAQHENQMYSSNSFLNNRLSSLDDSSVKSISSPFGEGRTKAHT
ncbi:hypothetical protein KP509_25G048200 [Ceratopteris richardii]|uniref:Glutamate receptor n=1 Tax=Ceratopteris richardii TaxID=49495 RepID=A0A8T2RSW3_CERRI|nr:hypothetical protein KP509_25G048200 [Ceratopteris richardii]